ncbi:MAG: glycerol-3-phosphate 1-O-acyltransferase PlsY [Thermodesulfovibrionales bacterium]|nr:glycerol-3-phosphate 1-O-acyltransferase PlsY [Thermodesulfovibrionales bacterium]
MTEAAILVLVSVASYLLGAVPFGLIFGRLWGIDPRLSGSKNIGATNLLRTAGIIPAILTLIFDISKGGIAVLIARALKVEPDWLAGLAAIVGHNFSVYLKFRGGKGVATSIGTMIVLYPAGGAVVIGIWLLVALITRYSSLAALISIGFSPVIFTVLEKRDMIAFTVLVASLVIMRHRDNIKRLLTGTEKKIGERVLPALGIIFILAFLNPVLAEGKAEYPDIESIKEESLNKGLRFPEAGVHFFLTKEPESILSQPVNTDSPLISFKKAERAFNTSVKDAFFTGIPYLIETFRLSAGNLIWLINLGLLFSLITIVSLLFAFFIASITRLPFELPLLTHEISEKKSTALYLLMLIIGAIAGLPYFAGTLLLLSAIHNPSKSLRISVIFYFIFILILPFILRFEQGFLRILSDPEIKAISGVNEGKDNKLILTLKESDSAVFMFSKALALKREGKIDGAIKILESLSKNPDYRVFNNLANCLFLNGDLSNAEAYYQKALELKKNPQSLYNLSQLFKERLDFEKGKYYYEEAMKIDAELISSFTKISSKSPNRFLMDITLNTGELVKFTIKKIAGSAFSLRMHEIVIPLILFALLFIRFPALAYRCSRCGKIICNICQRKELWGKMCPECYEVLVTPDKTDSRTRLQRLLYLQNKKSQRRRIFWVLTFLPGITQIVSGAMFQGLLILFLIGISIMSFVAYEHFFIANLKQFYLIWTGILSGTLALLLHLLSLRRLSRIWP